MMVSVTGRYADISPDVLFFPLLASPLSHVSSALMLKQRLQSYCVNVCVLGTLKRMLSVHSRDAG